MKSRLVLYAVLLLTLAACNILPRKTEPATDGATPRAQLSVGYSLLYAEAEGIPKLNWILKFKDQPEAIGRLTAELTDYYQQLAQTLRRLYKQYPGLRINVPPMSQIESDARKAIGADLAKDLAPVTGKTGLEFEREAMLMFYNSLNEQRHLVAVMMEREPDPELKKFLETTRTQLDSYYAKVGNLLNRRYFTH